MWAFCATIGKNKDRKAGLAVNIKAHRSRSLEFLTYLTQILSSGETVQLLDELMKYYTSARVQEAERGADTVNAVLKRLETVIWELAQLLERATGIERVRILERQINSDSRFVYLLTWLLLPESLLLLLSFMIRESALTLYITMLIFIITLVLTSVYALRSYTELHKMEIEAKSSIKKFD